MMMMINSHKGIRQIAQFPGILAMPPLDKDIDWLVGWLVGFVALRPKSTAMVIAGRSVHLTTLFPGQA